MSWTHLLGGAWQYLTLPDAPAAVQNAHLATCAACDASRVYNEDEVGRLVRWAVGTPRALWCGHPGTPSPDGSTCGCCVGGEALPGNTGVVTLTHKGSVIQFNPALKTEKMGSPCPRRKW